MSTITVLPKRLLHRFVRFAQLLDKKFLQGSEIGRMLDTELDRMGSSIEQSQSILFQLFDADLGPPGPPLKDVIGEFGLVGSPATRAYDDHRHPAIIEFKGDVLTTDGIEVRRLPVGGAGRVLTADPAETTGLRWTPKGGSVSGSGGDSLTEHLIAVQARQWWLTEIQATSFR
jgi:hypothetical protein